jgi:hypothetical protein
VFKEFIKKYWRIIILGLVSPVFFVLYSWLPGQTQGQGVMQFNSPDETGNFFWTSRVAEGKPLYIDESLEDIANNLIRLRGMNVAGGKLVPGSFLGMNFIYGLIGKITTPDIIPYLTPLFAVIGILFLYFLLSLIFSKDIALLSSLLAFTLPGWMYFANRSMFHNVLFVALLIIGIYILLKVLLPSRAKSRDLTQSESPRGEISPRAPYHSLGRNDKRWKWFVLFQYALAGIFIGLALITRLSELGWVALMLLLIFVFNFKKINWPAIVLFVGFLFFTFVPVFAINFILYNAPLSIGYDTGLTGEFGTLLTQAPLLFRLLVSPFGFHPVSIVLNGFNYIVQFFWWLTAPAFFGIIFWLFSKPQINADKTQRRADTSLKPLLRKEESLRHPPLAKGRSEEGSKKPQWAYFIIFLIISLYLVIFYGSWQITDRIDNSTLSIGTSYIRYFLPIYLMMLPFIAVLIKTILTIFRFDWAKLVVGALIVLFLSIPSFLLVGWTTDESLLDLRQTLIIQDIKAQRVRAIVPAEAVVVAGFKQSDKIVFPERRVIPELAVAYDYESLARLAQIRPLYYYHFAPTSTVEFISRRDFEEFGLRIDVADGVKIFGEERIYSIKKIVDKNPL